jgi:hypothetical protein
MNKYFDKDDMQFFRIVVVVTVLACCVISVI